MAITYKTVIANAIADFNAIQTELYALKAKRADGTTAITSISGTLVPTAEFDDIIKNQLQLKAVGNKELTQQTGTDVTAFATASVRSAEGFSLAITDNSNTEISGSLSGDWYTFSTNLTGELTATTAGWFTKGSATHGSVKVGKIKKGSITKGTPTEDGEDLKIVDTYTGGYLANKDVAGGTVTHTINAATFGVTNGSTASFTFAGKTDENITGATNLSSTLTVSESNENLSGFFFPVAVTAGSSGSIKSTSAGYVKNNKDIGSVTTSGETVAYVRLPSATGTVSVTSIAGSKELNPTLAANTSASGSSSTNVTSGILSAELTTNKPTGAGYYIAIDTPEVSTKLTGSADANIGNEGYIQTSYNFTAVPFEATVKTTGKTTYIPIKTGDFQLSGGALSVDATSFTPDLGATISSQTTTGATISPNAPASGTYNIHIAATSTGRTIKASTTAISASVKNDGYISSTLNTAKTTAADEETISVVANAEDFYVTIPSATFAAAATSGTTYTLDEDLTLSYEDGGTFLYVNEGYTPNKKFSLGKLIPDITNDAISKHILSGYSAYNEDGVLISGGIGNATFSNDFFTTTAGDGVGGVAGGTYIPENTTYYIKKGSVTSSKTDGTAVTPTLSTITDTATSRNALNVGMGNAITTEPSTGFYVAVKSNTASSSGSATFNVGTGWVDSSASATKTVDFTVNESNVHYIPVAAGGVSTEVVYNASTDAPEVNVTAQSSYLASGTSDFKITLNFAEEAGEVKAKYNVGTSGYVTSGTTETTAATTINPVVKFDGTETAKKDLYIKAGNVTGGGLSVTSVTTSPTALTQAAKLATSTTDYVTVSTTAAQVTVTEGYVTAAKTFTADSVTAKINAAKPGTITAGTPSASVSFTEVTTYNATTGAISSQSKKSDTSTIASVTVINDESYKDTYLIGGIGAKTNAGSATASMNGDQTGETVDAYVESLYKRILGQSYTDVSAD